MTHPTAHERAQPHYPARPPIDSSTLVMWSIVSFGGTGLAWLFIWAAVSIAQEDLVEGLPVAISWTNAVMYFIAGLTGAAVCFGLRNRVESRRARTKVVAFCAGALALGVAAVLFVVALPFL